jgi:soluble lytic murein transglycosylase-like protein
VRLRFFAVAIALFAATAQAGAFGEQTSQRRENRTATTSEFGRVPVPVPHYLAELIREASAKHGVAKNLLAAVIFKESAFKTNAVSRIGAEGLMQLMPKTAKWLGVKDSFDPRQNVLGGTKYLRMMLDEFDGDVELALAAYNAGPQRVKKFGPAATEEAVEYVAKIKTYL